MSRSERGPVRERLVPGENLTEVAVIDGSSIAAECRNDERSHKYYTPHTLTSPLIALIVLSRQFSGDLPPLDSADCCLDEPAETDGMPPRALYAAGTSTRIVGTRTPAGCRW